MRQHVTLAVTCLYRAPKLDKSVDDRPGRRRHACNIGKPFACTAASVW
jgi:hypothetical protein